MNGKQTIACRLIRNVRNNVLAKAYVDVKREGLRLVVDSINGDRINKNEPSPSDERDPIIHVVVNNGLVTKSYFD